MPGNILEANNLSKSFGGVHALDDVSMRIQAGEIHCLVGENGSGKSTFVKVISGAITPDDGEIIVNGHSYRALNPIEAIHEGIQVIYQDLSLFPHMSVAENISMNKMVALGKKFVNKAEIRRTAEEQLSRIGEVMDLDVNIDEISMANRQLVAICRALSLDAKLLFMDEPTTALTNIEVERLLKIVLELKQKGLSVVFISHKLNEVFQVADTITIFRDGRKAGDFVSKDLTYNSLINYMTGRKVEYPRYVRKSSDNSTKFEIRGLSRPDHYENVNIKMCPGDILGVTGLRGSGREELALSLFGLNPPKSGQILINGKPVSIHSPTDAVASGLSLLPEDRYTQAIFPTHSISENISSASLPAITTKAGLLNRKAETQNSTDMVEKLHIRTPDVETLVQNLSGGNQQKSVIARWVLTDPHVLILDGPTVGVDIASKVDIYEQIQNFASQGMSIILISDELPELLANCNSVMVMRANKVVGFLSNEELGQPDVAVRLQSMMSDGKIDFQPSNTVLEAKA
jgi:simple sugar transport system ATP-binding protein